jgi:protein-S-isoprenylcysteine O-methyltransferase Ste14
MEGESARKDIYAAHGSSVAQRIAIAAAVGLCLCAAFWLLLDDGISKSGAWFGWDWIPGDKARRTWLAAALAVYFIRLLFTQFVFLKRAIRWSEACMIAPWVLFIYLFLAIAGGTNPAPIGVKEVVGVVLFVFGSWMNSYAEFARHVWKQHPENRGRLYTLSLFRYSRHPNYLGDLLSFSGLCLISGRWETVVIPLIMLSGFVFANIPMLDSHLHEHYGAAFDEYAARTSKLIPFLY